MVVLETMLYNLVSNTHKHKINRFLGRNVKLQYLIFVKDKPYSLVFYRILGAVTLSVTIFTIMTLSTNDTHHN